MMKDVPQYMGEFVVIIIKSEDQHFEADAKCSNTLKGVLLSSLNKHRQGGNWWIFSKHMILSCDGEQFP